MAMKVTDVKQNTAATDVDPTQNNGWNQLSTNLNDLVSAEWLKGMFDGVDVGGENIPMDELFDKIIKEPPADDEAAEAALKKLADLASKLGKVKDGIKDLEAKKKELMASTTATDEQKKAISEQLENVKKLVRAMESEIADGAEQLEKGLSLKETDGTSKYDDATKTAIKKFIQQHGSKSGKSSGSKASTLGEDGGGGADKTGGTGGAKASTTDPNNPYGIGKGYNVGGVGQNFNPMAMTMAQQLDDGLGSIIDMQGEAKKRQQMMMLFFYYARMAMSGDLGAMYQFMRFLTYVISRDKALQNVWAGTKLIQLQEVSRKAQERMLNTKVDADDPQSQIEWQKELQKIRGEETMVATSQKLITQMMEEFAQVSESLNNVTKAMLDAHGSTMRNLSMIKT